MERNVLVEKLQKHWEDWQDYEEPADEVIELCENFLNRFEGMNWQEQDLVISTLQAIRG